MPKVSLIVQRNRLDYSDTHVLLFRAGMNAVVRSVVRTGIARGHDVYAIYEVRS